MSSEELWFSLIATAIGSGLAVKVFEAFIDWRKGRVSKISALETALDNAEAAIRSHEEAKRVAEAAHAHEISEMLDQVRGLEIQAHRMHVQLISLGHDPEETASEGAADT